MPTKIEKDSISGQLTTGHEWDGIKELNRPLPKWWVYIFIATVIWSGVYFVLYPSIPGISGYFHGLLGYSTRDTVEADVAAVVKQRSVYMDRIAALPYDAIRKDRQLLAVAETAGRIIFADNCQPCHGAGGGGSPGFPALAAGNWLWGGKLADIETSIVFGIRGGHDNARQSAMPRFGVDAMLKPDEIQAVADHVMVLYGKSTLGSPAGAKIFAENCVACHGEAGQGNRDVGGPRLASRTHLNADDRATVVGQIANPRMGVMPHWNTRLDQATIKSLTLYVHALGGGE